MTELAAAVCECCGRALPANTIEAELLAWCVENGHLVTADGEVRTETAALLLGVSPQWLRQAACYFESSVPPSRKVGRHRLWRLADIAARIERA